MNIMVGRSPFSHNIRSAVLFSAWRSSGGGKPEAQQHRNQAAFADGQRGLGRGEPAPFALALLRPVLHLLLDLQKKNGDLALDGSFFRQALLVAVGAIGELSDLAPDP